jgi:heat shock protein HtpX
MAYEHDREQREKAWTSWLYTLGVFIIITIVSTFILAFPIFSEDPLQAMATILGSLVLGFIVACCSAYALTPWTLRRKMKPFEDAPPQVLKSIEELSKKAELKKAPKLMIAETPEINAMTYTSIFGNKICITRGLMNAYQSGNIDEGELSAILGHEIGHIKNLDCLKHSLVLSWISILDIIGELYIMIGAGITRIGVWLGEIIEETMGKTVIVRETRDRYVVREEGAGGLVGCMIMLYGLIFGWSMIISGFIMKIIAKIASILAFHLIRKLEYAADAFGAGLSSGGKMISALRKIALLNSELIVEEITTLPYADRWQLQPRNPSWIDRLFDTHPPIENRVAALQTPIPMGSIPKGLDLRKLVMESEYDEIISLTLRDENVALKLAQLLEDPATEVRENAAEAIARIGKDDFQVPKAIKTVMPQLMNLLNNPEAQIREAATQALVGIAWNWIMWEDFGGLIKPVIPRLVKLLDDPDARVRKYALETIKVIAEWIEDRKEAIEQIEPALPRLWISLENVELCGDAIWALRAIAHSNPELVKPMIGEIMKLLRDANDHIRLGSIATLKYIAEAYPKELRTLIPSLLILLEDTDWRVCQNAAIVLGFIAGEIAEVAGLVVPKLTELLGDDRPLFRADAARALARIGEIYPEMIRPALPWLRKLLEDSDEKVRESAAMALKMLTLIGGDAGSPIQKAERRGQWLTNTR